MKKIILIFGVLIFHSCFRTEDDSNNDCTLDCTTLVGRIITMDNQGISDVNLTFKYFKGASLTSYTRIISDLDSDNEGNFYDEFYLEDEEIDDSSVGNLILEIDENSLNLNDYIITPNSANFFLERWFDISNRDTIIEQIFYFPKKANVIVNLNNFIPIQENDRFEVRVMFPYGYIHPEPDELNDLLETNYIPTLGRELYEATQVNNSLNVTVAENEKNLLRVFKTKDGIFTSQDFVIDVNSSNPEEITIEF